MGQFIVIGIRDFVVGSLAQAFGQALYEVGYFWYSAINDRKNKNKNEQSIPQQKLLEAKL